MAIFGVLTSDRPHNDQHHNAANYENYTKPIHNNSSSFFKIGAWADANHDAIEALSAIGVLFLTIILAGSTIGLWIITLTTAKAAREGASAAKTAADAALAALDRPWLFINILENSYTVIKPGQYRLYVKFNIINHGKAPAMIFSAKAALFYSPPLRSRKDFPVDPLPSTMKEFPDSDELRVFIYTTHGDETEVISFCYEGDEQGPLKTIRGAPYNERRKVEKAK